MPNFKIKQEYISVSLNFIENLLPEANPTFVKVYLYALMLASTYRPCESSFIAQNLGILESDVLLAMKYWEEKGLLCENGDLKEDSSLIQEKVVETNNNIIVEKNQEDVEVNAELKQMLRLAQEVLGKTLTTADTKTLYWIHQNLNLPIEVILVILEYCVSINKRNMTYIEQVAVSWSERGINTLEEADKFVKEQSEKENTFFSLKRLFGINSREFTSIELNYLNTWTSSYSMSEEMIALAYEYCILRINKISFPYMDKIIENWFENNIHTISDAEKENETFREKTEKKINDTENVKKEEAVDEFEKIMWEKLKNEN